MLIDLLPELIVFVDVTMTRIALYAQSFPCGQQAVPAMLRNGVLVVFAGWRRGRRSTITYKSNGKVKRYVTFDKRPLSEECKNNRGDQKRWETAN